MKSPLLLLLALVVLAGLLASKSEPELRRYLKIRSM